MLAKRLRDLRTSMRLTQKEVANKLHISRVRYNHYENGKRQPDHEMLKQLSKLFNVTVDYLIGNDNNKTTELHAINNELYQLLNNPDIISALNIFMIMPESDKYEIIDFINFKKKKAFNQEGII